LQGYAAGPTEAHEDIEDVLKFTKRVTSITRTR
jgi:hypothetical protein